MKWIGLISALFVGACAFSAQADDTPLNEVDTAVEQSTTAPATTTSNSSRTRKAKSEKNDYAPAQDMLLQAMSLIGVKYKYGGATPEAGLDCSGFVRYVFQNSMNIALPHNALAMAQSGSRIDKEELKPGDLVFFNTLGRTFSHVGIYMGDNRFIHSPRAGKSVEITNIGQSYWSSRFTGARRYDGTGGAPVNMAALLASVPKTPVTASRVSLNTSKTAEAKPVCKIVRRKGKKQRVCEAPPAQTRSSAKSSGSSRYKASTKTSSKVAAPRQSSKKNSTANTKSSSKARTKSSAKSSTAKATSTKTSAKSSAKTSSKTSTASKHTAAAKKHK
ncbi:MAG: C40 family peptidase [Iodobacter sp.]